MPPTPPTPPASQRVSIPAELDGSRLDLALVQLLPGLSRARIQEWIRDGGISLGGQVERRPSVRVAAEQQVEMVDVPRSRERPGAPDGLDFRVVCEEEDFVVLDKPQGMVVHPSSVVRGGTLSELAQERFGPLPSPQGEDRHGVVHRLDAGTSGLLVIARTEAAGAELKRQFREHEVDKRYLALAFGSPRFESDWIEAPLGRAARSGDRVSVVAEGKGKPARTFYEVRERFDLAALLACRLVTGRTHQIRVHLESIGHPVVGDRLYQGRRGRRPQLPGDAPAPSRQLLHAEKLAFRHPSTGEALAFEAPLPEDFRSLLDWLRGRATSGGS